MSEILEVVDRLLSEKMPALTAPGQEPTVWGHAERGLWESVEALGLTLVAVAEDRGGSGGTTSDACEVVRSAAKHSAPLPVAETGLLAGWALARCGIDVPAGPMTVAGLHSGDVLRVERAAGHSVIAGRAVRVPWASVAEHIVCIAQPAAGEVYVSLVPARCAEVTPGFNVAGEPRDVVVLNVGAGPGGQECRAAPPDLLDAMRLRAALARSVQICGAIETTQERTVRYAAERRQFGRPIGQFQAVAQRIALLASDAALARASVTTAIAACERQHGTSEFEVAVAKALCSRAARLAAAAAHQVHGAIGVTAEYPLQLSTRRLWAWQDEFGSEDHWARVITQHLRRRGDDPWEIISAVRAGTGEPA